MRRIFNILIGIMAIFTLGNKVISCPMCEEKIFGFPIHGGIYLAIWAFVAYSCFSQEYRIWAAKR